MLQEKFLGKGVSFLSIFKFGYIWKVLRERVTVWSRTTMCRPLDSIIHDFLLFTTKYRSVIDRFSYENGGG